MQQPRKEECRTRPPLPLAGQGGLCLATCLRDIVSALGTHTDSLASTLGLQSFPSLCGPSSGVWQVKGRDPRGPSPLAPCLPPLPPPFQTSPSLHSGLSLQLQDQSWFSQGLLSSVPGTRSLRSLYRLFQPPAPQRRHHLLGRAHPHAH